ncbi:DUF2164 family protein [Candidatus Gracilibacteria bacterium]|nr:DUF2164 family protein [Candidatus Gracilibacteria bacterium]
MNKRKLSWDSIPEDKKKQCLDNIIAFAQASLDSQIGVVAAEELYDTVMESTFDQIYNQGVLAAQKVMQEKIADLNVDLESLLKK